MIVDPGALDGPAPKRPAVDARNGRHDKLASPIGALADPGRKNLAVAIAIEVFADQPTDCRRLIEVMPKPSQRLFPACLPGRRIEHHDVIPPLCVSAHAVATLKLLAPVRHTG